MVRPGERRQIGMVKIPVEIARALGTHDGNRILISIRAGRREVYRGPLTVTSGLEVYLPKNLQQLLEREDELVFDPL